MLLFGLWHGWQMSHSREPSEKSTLITNHWLCNLVARTEWWQVVNASIHADIGRGIRVLIACGGRWLTDRRERSTNLTWKQPREQHGSRFVFFFTL